MSVPFAGPVAAQLSANAFDESDDKRSLSNAVPEVAEVKQSLGVRRIEIINSQLTPFWRAWLWIGASLLPSSSPTRVLS